MRKIVIFFRNYFKEQQKKRKVFLTRRGVLLIFLVVVFLEFFALANFMGKFSLEQFLATIAPSELVEMTNIRRDGKELNTLNESYLLANAAQMKADDMAERGYFAHTCPDGLTPWHWFDEVGYNYHYAGENLAVNFREAHQVDEAWMNSPSHRDNIVNEKFEEIGIATATGEYKGREAIFVVQLFGTRVEERSAFEAKESIEESFFEEKQEGVLGEDFSPEKEDLKEEGAEEEVYIETQKEAEKEVGLKEEIETEKEVEVKIKEKESFAFIEKTDKEDVFFVIGKPADIIRERKEDLKYITFWGRLSSSTERLFGYLFLSLAVLTFLALVLKVFFMKKTRLAYLIINEFLVVLVVFSAFLTNHYVLHFFK